MNIRKIFSKKKKDIVLDKGNPFGRGLSKVSIEDFFKGKESSNKTLRDYWDLYRTDAITAGTVNAMVFKILGKGYRMQGNDTELASDLLERVKVILSYKTLATMIRDTIIFGDSFGEIVFNVGQTEILTVVPRNPLDFVIKNDKIYFGKKPLDSKKMLHFQLFNNLKLDGGVSSMGLSLLGFVFKASNDRQDIYKALVSAIKRHGTSKYHVKISPDERNQYPGKDEMQAISLDFKNMESRTEYVTTDRFDIQNIDVMGVPAIKDYQEFMLNETATGFLTPIEVLGMATRGATHATAHERIKMFNITIAAFQKIIAGQINEQLINQIIASEAKVKFQFEDITEETLTEKMQWMKFLIPAGDPFCILERDEIRELLNIPPVQKENENEEEEDFVEKEKGKNNNSNNDNIDLSNGLEPDKLYKDTFEVFSNGWEKCKENIKKETFETINSGEL